MYVQCWARYPEKKVPKIPTSSVAAEMKVRDPLGEELGLLVDHEAIPLFASCLGT